MITTINIEIINGDRKDPAGQIISNDNIFKDIKDIVGEENFIIFKAHYVILCIIRKDRGSL